MTRLLAIAALLLPLGCRQSTELVVFHAASLTRALDGIRAGFEAENPQLRLRLEPGGSLTAARKVAELGRRADLVALADTRAIARLLIPEHARWSLDFASNAMVLSHRDHSRHTAELTAENWAEILLRPDVRLGRVDERTAPIGYRTLLVWALAEQRGGPRTAGLSAALRQRVSSRFRVADETELLALLQARSIDYAFVYRSSAEAHHLKITELGAELDLGDPAHAADYAGVSVPVELRAGGASELLRGEPVLYALTIPGNAAHPEAASQLVAWWLGEQGRRVMLRAGFRPLHPAPALGFENLPAELRPLAVAKVSP